jgi:uncharacterized protein
VTGKPWRTIDDRLMLRVRLTPRASRDCVDGIVETPFGPALEARVRAVADKGEANAALEELIARALKLPKSAVAMTAGFRSRIKTLAIAGEARPLAALLKKQFDKPA